MEYPNLLLAIRQSGHRQYEIARVAGMREARLSEIVRRGGATCAERRALSKALRLGDQALFAHGIGLDEAPKRTRAAGDDIASWGAGKGLGGGG